MWSLFKKHPPEIRVVPPEKAAELYELYDLYRSDKKPMRVAYAFWRRAETIFPELAQGRWMFEFKEGSGTLHPYFRKVGE